MFAAMLLAISIVALGHFAFFYWRAILSGVAAQPVSARVLDSAGVAGGRLSAKHFLALAELHDLTASLDPAAGSLSVVRSYYQIVRTLGALFGGLSPNMASWSERERTICARYAAVQVDRRLQANLALSASLRSC
jgi:hypothetical protein